MQPETVRVRGKGEITLPSEIRQKLGIEVGALLSISLTEGGVLLQPAEVVMRGLLDQISTELKAEGATQNNLMTETKKQRAKIAKEKYGIGTKSAKKPRIKS